MLRIQPVSGCALDRVADLDRHFPGVAGAFLRASAERRQVIAALLAGPNCRELGDEQIANLVMSGNHQTILRTAYGDVPPGFRGALGRAGSQPHPPSFYPMLHAMLAQPAHSGVRRAIGQSATLDLSKLRIVSMLPLAICTSDIAEAATTVGQAKEIIALISTMASCGIDQAAFFLALRQVQSDRQLTECLKRWALKAMLPPHPVAASDAYRPVTSAAGLREIARRYRNCIEQRFLTSSLDGEDAFAEFRLGEVGKGIVVHLQRRSGRWWLDGMYGPHNAQPKSELRLAATQYLETQGVRAQPKQHRARGPWAALGRLTSPFLYAEME